MEPSYRDGRTRARRGSGSIRERRAGVWEIRVVVPNDPHTGRSIQRSFTMHGDADTAEAYRIDLVERFGLDKRALCVGTHLVGEGKILKAQARLGHRDPVTTLRHYAHATPLDDLDVADHLDDLLNAAIG